MLYGVHELQRWEVGTQMPSGQWVAARPLWVSWGRWKHAWWVFTGRCDAIYWPEDGNPYWSPSPSTSTVNGDK
jgi:hypothetical protein